jgi:hypothetical protein
MAPAPQCIEQAHGLSCSGPRSHPQPIGPRRGSRASEPALRSARCDASVEAKKLQLVHHHHDLRPSGSSKHLAAWAFRGRYDTENLTVNGVDATPSAPIVRGSTFRPLRFHLASVSRSCASASVPRWRTWVVLPIATEQLATLYCSLQSPCVVPKPLAMSRSMQTR